MSRELYPRLVRRSQLKWSYLLITLALTAVIAAPVLLHAQPGCGTTTVAPVDQPSLLIPDLGTVDATMNIAGLGTTLLDVDLLTTLPHERNDELSVILTSPVGTEVTLTTKNGSGSANGFDGSTWDDDAGDTNPPGPVTDNTFGSAVETPIVPEEAMGAFIGENPNGTWTLTITDDAGSGNTGGLFLWRLTLKATSQTIIEETSSLGNNTPGPILDNSLLTSTINVAGAGTYVSDVDLTTNISHTGSGDLSVFLTSPEGTEVTISTRNGGDLDDVFAGTLWDDDGGDTNPPGPVTDATLVDDVTETPLVPEEAMAAFIGENPNGIWVLGIRDVNPPDTGSLDGWSLHITTASCPLLPVELTLFEVVQDRGELWLHWSTASETNNSGFEVQAQKAGDASGWETLGFVSGAGTTTEEQSYAYRVLEPGPGMRLFRLKQIDLDGAYGYSDELEARVELASTHVLGTAYPNPFNASTVFTLAVADDQHVLVEVYDETGRRVGVVHDGLLAADMPHEFRFEAGHLASGVYIYRATGERFVASRFMLLVK